MGILARLKARHETAVGSRRYQGSALVLTMFIMAGMLIVALGSAYVALLGIKGGGTQAQSTKAYFAAEAGAERLIWEVRKHGAVHSFNPNVASFSGTLVASSSYEVYFTQKVPSIIFTSIGEYMNTRRSVEIKFEG
jgi:hypothetical protein